jgi:Transposase DDE domain
MKAGCYKDRSKTKSYSVTLMSNTHKVQAEFQNTEYFKQKTKERYKIEAKNSEVKHSHGYDVATSSGLICMEMQGALTIFTVNLKRILKLI